MRLLSPEYRLQQAVVASLGLHAVFAGVMLTKHFGDESLPDSKPSPQSLLVTVVTRPRPVFPEPGIEEEIISDVNEMADEPADDITVAEITEEDVSPADSSISDSDEEQEIRIADADSQTAPVPVITSASLQDSVNRIVTTHRRQGQSVWQAECWREQQRNQKKNCDDESLVLSPLHESEQRAKEVFAARIRADEQRAVSNRLQDELAVLTSMADNTEVAGLVSAQQYSRKEQLAYLNGNFNDNYWVFVQEAFRYDPNVDFLRYLGTPRCADGPCVFEYTPPGGTRNIEEKDEGFRLGVPDLPYYSEEMEYEVEEEVYNDIQDQFFSENNE